MKTAAPKPPQKKIQAAKRAVLAAMIKDRPELEAKLGQLSRATIMHNSLTAELNAELETIKQRFATKLAAQNETIEECTTSIESYCVNHREEVFGKEAKSADIAGHTVSLRDNGGAVGTNKGITQETVLDRLLNHENEETADLFVRWKASIDKDVIKAKWPDHTAFLEGLGLKIEHTENFSITLNLEAGASSNVKAA